MIDLKWFHAYFCAAFMGVVALGFLIAAVVTGNYGLPLTVVVIAAGESVFCLMFPLVEFLIGKVRSRERK